MHLTITELAAAWRAHRAAALEPLRTALHDAPTVRERLDAAAALRAAERAARAPLHRLDPT